MTADLRWWEEVFSAEERAIYQAYRRERGPRFPWRASMLMIVDATHAFLGPRLPTSQACRAVPTACGLPGWRAVPHMAALLGAYRAAGLPACYTRQDRSAEEAMGGATAGAARKAGGTGAADEIIAELRPVPGELVIAKPKASGFFGTGLVAHCLRSHVEGIVLAGGTTSGCVRATALDACSYGLDVVIVSDGCFDRSRLSAAVALFEMDVKSGRVMTSAQVIGELRAGTQDAGARLATSPAEPGP